MLSYIIAQSNDSNATYINLLMNICGYFAKARVFFQKFFPLLLVMLCALLPKPPEFPSGQGVSDTLTQGLICWDA